MMMFAYYLSVFLSAFLLFIIQPMLSKALLPGFGGSYLVWGAAMVFFQAVLLAGYIFSHTMQKWLGVVRYARWHWLLLLLPFLFFPFRFDLANLEDPSLALAPAVFLKLLVMVGGPFLTLSMTSLILQRWLMISPLKGRSNPYVLYSVSNAGSVLALLAYPLLVEPFCGLESQGMLWWGGYAVLVVLHGVCYPRKSSVESSAAPDGVFGVTWRQRGTWFMLSLGACAMLLAVTNVITFDVASAPLLWVLPLVLYLLAFVLTFKRVMWFPRWMASGLDWAALAGMLLFLMLQLRISVPPVLSLFLHLLILFVVCMSCSARLVETRPVAEGSLTDFYVTLATGGLFGSILISWVIPLLSSTLVEYIIGLILVFAAVRLASPKRETVPAVARRHGLMVASVCGGLMLVSVTLLPYLLSDRVSANVLFALVALPAALLFRYAAGRPLLAGLLLGVFVLGGSQLQTFSGGVTRVASLRNYYGIYNVYDRDGIRYLQHGTTQHGRQYLEGGRRAVPLAYFHPSTPAATVMTEWQSRFHDIGMIGLGTGALAMYTGPGQRFTVYELDPDNLMLAERYFTYLKQAREKGADIHFVFGDGRVSLHQRPTGSLDLLVLDAFNSGSIPVHLLTVEAFNAYFRVLREDGLLLLHVSNKALDLVPTVYANAAAIGGFACEQSNDGHVDPDAEYTVWMAVCRQDRVIGELKRELFWYGRRPAGLAGVSPWTDRYSNILGTLRWLR